MVFYLRRHPIVWQPSHSFLFNPYNPLNRMRNVALQGRPARACRRQIMFIKSFTALGNNGRLTGVRTAQLFLYDRVTSYLYGSTVPYPPEYDTERQCLEHQTAKLSESEWQHCSYVDFKAAELRLTRRLQQIIPGVASMVSKPGGHCYHCGGDCRAG